MEPIAVIGLAVRLPSGIESAERYWDVIRQARQLRKEIPADRFNLDGFYHPNHERTDSTNVRYGHFLDGDMSLFDAQFFSIQPIEAESMDPQQRVLMETSYRALENAGIPLQSVAGSRTSVYIAQGSHDYEAMLYRDSELTPKYMGTGVHGSFLANRLSWFYDFHGPSMTVDTACSGSLSALHLACQSLRDGDVNMAMAGGGSLILNPELSMNQLSTLGFLSPDGVSYSFDSRANGYAKGEGMGVVILKRLSDAVQDGDTIRAIIRGTSINQDGRTPGITQPSGKSQAFNIKRAYENCGLTMDQTTYFEAHGTGTPVGDPIEAQAIYDAFQRDLDNPLFVGSVKANIGHLEAGAGVAGLIKTILILENGEIPPNAAFNRVNPKIPADEWGLKFARHSIPFTGGQVRRASINSFGFGGTNGHAIIDDALSYFRDNGSKEHDSSVLAAAKEAVVNSKMHTNHQPRIFVWSAADEKGIARTAEAFQAHFQRLPDDSQSEEDHYLDLLSFTLSKRRSQLPWKSFYVASTIAQLRSTLTEGLSKPMRSSVPPAVSFIFTGQGAQWYAMGRGLDVFPIYHHSLQKSARCLKDLGCTWDLMVELSKDQDCSRIDQPEVSQPACSILQIALVDLLKSWNIHPSAVTGHSSGEIAAAYCVGALSQDSAVRVAFQRGIVAAKVKAIGCRKGAMVAVSLSPSQAQTYIEKACSTTAGYLAVGCSNAPQKITVTGDENAIDEFEKLMEEEKIFARKLLTGVAYHSNHMQEVANEYLTSIRDIGPSCTSLMVGETRVFSSVTGKRITKDKLSSPQYWVDNLIGQVEFSGSLNEMINHLIQERSEGGSNPSAQDLMLEVGPHAALQRPVKDVINNIKRAKNFGYVPILKRDEPQITKVLGAIGNLYSAGCTIDLVSINNLGTRKEDLHPLVDLPVYRFNHSQKFWVESIISEKFRFRHYQRHELLGLRDVDWSYRWPRWRNVIRLSENPWIRDHQFDGSCLFPAAGALVMVIEGARQLISGPSQISGYQLDNISFVNSFPIPEGASTVEAHLSFAPRFDNSGNPTLVHNFTVSARMAHDFSEICRGSITVYTTMESYDTNTQASNRLRLTGLGEILIDGSTSQWETVNSIQFYKNMKAMGYDLGPCFQSMKSLTFTEDGKASASVLLDEWSSKCETLLDLPHVIHPTDLDAVFQTTVAAYSKGSRQRIPVLIPSKIKSLYISHNLLNRSTQDGLKVVAEKTFQGYREADFSIAATSRSKEPVLVVRDFRQTAVQLVRSDETTSSLGKQFCFYPGWRPDIDLMSEKMKQEICKSALEWSQSDISKLVDRQELVSLFYMKITLESIVDSNMKRLPEHLEKYCDWLRHQYDPRRLQELRSADPESEQLFSNDDDCERFLSKLVKDFPESEITVEVGSNLMRVLRGEQDVLGLLFSNGLASRFYATAFGPRFQKSMIPFIDLIAHKNHALEVLEIGAGTGSTTDPTLAALTKSYTSDSNCIPRFKHYTFTDISPAFFGDAKERFSRHGTSITYRTLNIEEDVTGQGFENGRYDLIVCGAVLHATADLSRTLRNVRGLLKPGGRLVLLEPCNPTSARTGFIFGLLPGWWLSVENERRWSPLIGGEAWNRLLRDAGFVDIYFVPDHEDPARQTFGGVIATANGSHLESRSLSQLNIVISDSSTYQYDIAQGISQALFRHVDNISIISSQQWLQQEFNDSYCIVLIETEISFFSDIDEHSWQRYKTAIEDAAGHIWVTKSGDAPANRPLSSIVTGLGRNIRSEKLDSHFVEVTLNPSSPVEQAIMHIVKVFQQSQRITGRSLESEYVEVDGELCIARLTGAAQLNRKVGVDTLERNPVKRIFGSDLTRALKLTIAAPGLIDTLRFDDDDKYEVPLHPHDVEIEVKASGIIFKDALVAVGQISNNKFGYECSGIVVRVGSDVNLRPGDRVCCVTTSGSFKTFVRAEESTVLTIPDSMSWEVAAALPFAMATVYHSFVTIANLQPSESVLVHSGAGGVGQIAVQVAQKIGAEVFVTVGNAEKRELMRQRYNIPEDHIFSSRNVHFAEKIMSYTETGVDVVLNSLTGPGQLASWSCIAPLGRFIELGKRDIDSGKASLPMAPFGSNVTFAAIDVEAIMKNSKRLTKQMMQGVSEMLASSSINPVQPPHPLHIYNVGQIEQAFRFMLDGERIGKVVVNMGKDEFVPILPSLKPTYSLHRDATYVIAGGLGGLGRTLVEWMASRGARNFLLLSRKGSIGNTKAQSLIRIMAQRGIRIEAPPCDITDDRAVNEVLQTLARSMPPFRGCIQASMVLKDGLLDKISAEDLHAVLRPKTVGSLVLATHLPQEMDFFVFLSSIASLTGSRGQCNYSAANTFQDALARQLSGSGRRCISLNLGSILSVGYAAEHDLSDTLRRDGFEGISKAEFLSLLDYVCDPTCEEAIDPKCCHIVSGLSGAETLTVDHFTNIYWTSKPMMQPLLRLNELRNRSRSGGNIKHNVAAVNHGAELDAALKAGDPAASKETVLHALVARFSELLALPEQDVDAHKSILSFGIDSLIALELRYWIARELEAEVSVFDILNATGLDGLAAKVVGKRLAEEKGSTKE